MDEFDINLASEGLGLSRSSFDKEGRRITEKNLDLKIFGAISPTVGDISMLYPDNWQQATNSDRLDALNHLSKLYTDAEERNEVSIETGIYHKDKKSLESHQALDYRPERGKIEISQAVLKRNDPYQATSKVLEGLHLHYKISAVLGEIEHSNKVEIEAWKGDIPRRKDVLQQGGTKEEVQRRMYSIPGMKESKQFAEKAIEILQRMQKIGRGKNTLDSEFTEKLPKQQANQNTINPPLGRKNDEKPRTINDNQKPDKEKKVAKAEKPEEEVEQRKGRKKGLGMIR